MCSDADTSGLSLGLIEDSPFPFPVTSARPTPASRIGARHAWRLPRQIHHRVQPSHTRQPTTLPADALTLLMVGHLIEREANGPGGQARAAAWCFTLFFAVWPYFSVVAMSGMEISAMPTLIALTAVMARRGSVVAATMWVDAYNLYVGRAQNEYYGFAAVADWLRDHVRPGDKVMLEPIGIVGWRNPVVVVDEVGLVSPAVARRRLQGPRWYADEQTGGENALVILRRTR